jgi:hypothetical protein
VLGIAWAVQLADIELYFGHHPQWLLIIDSSHIYLERDYDYWYSLGGAKAIALKIGAIAVPIWAARRVWRRMHRPATKPLDTGP